MKLLVVVVDELRQGDVIDLLQRFAITSYSIIPSVFGKGETGAHFGNRTFPGANAMILALISPGELDAVTPALRELHGRLHEEEGLKVIALDSDLII